MTRRTLPPFLIELLAALYFTGAQTSALVTPRCPWRIASRFESKRR